MRSLSPEEIQTLKAGEAMGLARATELNGHPGPARVLEAARAGKLDLYVEQREVAERLQVAAKAEAQALGRELRARGATPEAGFRTGNVVGADLAGRVEDIGRKVTKLCLTHLRAHLLTAAHLRPEQIAECYQFRGYFAPSAGRVLGY